MSDDARREIDLPSTFFREHAPSLAATAVLGRALDLACGDGRHSIAAAELGLRVLAVDRNHEALERLRTSRSDRQAKPQSSPSIETLAVDLEAQSAPALEAASFGAVFVFRYLHRPLAPWIQTLLAPGGLLIYETFTLAQRELDWGPRRDDFLLKSGELPSLFPDLEIEVYEEGPSYDERAPRTARLLARRPH